MKIESMFINKLTDVIISSCIYLYKNNPYHEILMEVQMYHIPQKCGTTYLTVQY